MASRLTKEHKKQLEIWIGKGKRNFELIFSLTKDGGTAQAFHDKCDNQGPTVTVVYNDHNSIYGGYASQSWKSNDSENVTDSEAFLYQLVFSGKAKQNKFPVKQVDRALYSYRLCGPIFGFDGHDLWTFNTAVYENGVYRLDGNMGGFGNNYNTSSMNAADVNNGSNTVFDIEVYKVTGIGTCAHYVCVCVIIYILN